MAAGREPLTETIVITGPADVAVLAAGAFPRVLVLVADLGDPALDDLIGVAPNAQDLADATRPGASPRTYFHARRALTRWLAGRRCGVAAADVMIGYDAAGAPRVFAPQGGGFVSVAGRGRLAAIAVADRQVGVDLEPLAAATEPVWDVLHPDEAAMLRALPADERARPFLGIWTAKEAALKALGEGFVREPAGVRVEEGWRHPSPPLGANAPRRPSPTRGEGLPASTCAPPLPLRERADSGRRPEPGEGSHQTFTLLDSTSSPLAHGIWAERAGALVAVALA